MELRPVEDVVAVWIEKPEETTFLGLVLPQERKIDWQYGEAFAVGPKVHDVKVGDRLMFGMYAGSAFKLDGRDMVFLREGEVSCLTS